MAATQIKDRKYKLVFSDDGNYVYMLCIYLDGETDPLPETRVNLLNYFIHKTNQK